MNMYGVVTSTAKTADRRHTPPARLRSHQQDLTLGEGSRPRHLKYITGYLHRQR